MLKSLALVLGFVGLSLSGVGALGICQLSLPQAVMNLGECAKDWDAIDGPRFQTGGAAWSPHGDWLRITITRNAYWPCSLSQTFLVRGDGGEVRLAQPGEAQDWSAATEAGGVSLSQEEAASVAPMVTSFTPTEFLLSPGGNAVAAWRYSFWNRGDFGLSFIDLAQGTVRDVEMSSQLTELEQEAIRHCQPKECAAGGGAGDGARLTDLSGGQIGRVILTGLSLMLPAALLWRGTFLSRIGLM